MRLRDPLHDRQTEPEPAVFARSRLAGAIEPLKNIESRLIADYMEAMKAYEKLPAEQRGEKPKLS